MAHIDYNLDSSGRIQSARIFVWCSTGRGKRVRKTETYTPVSKGRTRAVSECEAEALRFEIKCQNGGIMEAEKMYFSDLVEEYKEQYASIRGNMTQRVMDDYYKIIENKLLPRFGGMKINAITSRHVRLYVNELLTTPRENKKVPLSPGSVKKILAVLSSILTYASENDLIDYNPCLKVHVSERRAPGKEEAVHVWSPCQVKHYLDFLSGLSIDPLSGMPVNGCERDLPYQLDFQMEVLFNIAFYGGLRRGEILALTWDDIDFEKKMLSINKAASRVKVSDHATEQIIKETKTKGSMRTIPAPDSVMKLLKEWKSKQLQLIMKMGDNWKAYRDQRDLGKNSIFLKYSNVYTEIEGRKYLTRVYTGEQMDLDLPYTVFTHTVEKYNVAMAESEQLPKLRFHDIRHTCGTNLYGETGDILMVQRFLGHSDPRTTAQIYTHSTEAKEKELAAALEVYSAG